MAAQNVSDLVDLAFGSASGLDEFTRRAPTRGLDAPWPAGVCPAAPRDAWLAGVALGAAGRYAAAIDVLAPQVSARGADPWYASLASSTVASHRRQLGAHAEAYRWDGRALGLAARGRGADGDGALADAVLGLAADALGAGLLRRCARLLRWVRERGLLAHWRSRIRAGWVTTELLLASGDGEAALRQARATRDHAESTRSVRHLTKSEMLLATCLLLGSTERARVAGAELARDVIRTSLQRGMLTLVWPTALLLDATVPDAATGWLSAAGEAVTTVYGRSDGDGREAVRWSPWMPGRLLRAGDGEAARASLHVLNDKEPDRVKSEPQMADKKDATSPGCWKELP